MPIHDWTRVTAGDFHHFHNGWVTYLCAALNAGGLPDGYEAISEQVVDGPIPDALAIRTGPVAADGGVAVLDRPPTVRFVQRLSEPAVYAARARRIRVQHARGRVAAVIEIVSPGNKDSRHAIAAFVGKAAALFRAGVNVLVVDLFPPTPRDPDGMHGAVWAEVLGEPFALPPDKPLTLAAYSADAPVTAYVEPVAVGDALPDMPLFLTADRYVPVPLEATYRTTWDVMPASIRADLARPAG